jgi:universal stress protein E
MLHVKRILVVIDPIHDHQPALYRAVAIAKRTGARITALLTIYDFSYEMTTILSLEEREMMRQSMVSDRNTALQNYLATEFSSPEIEIEAKVIWHNRIFESVINETLENDYDVIVKSTHHHNPLKSVIFTPTDWHLMRKAPIDVLLVKEHEWPENGKIVAAVNLSNEDNGHDDLNHKITKTAREYGDMLNSNVHAVNAYPGTPVNVAIEIPEFNAQEFNDSVKEHHQTLMQQHAKIHTLPAQCCHVREGLPEDVIPQIANQLDAELVVIGTVGRNGLSAALIGNTAEHVIDLLNCDILALKPADFKCPITQKI